MREVSNAYGACTVRTFFSTHPSLAPVTPRGYMKYIEYLSCKNQQDQTPCDICECDKIQIHNPQLWAIAHSPLLFVEPRPRFSSQMDCSDKPSLLTACAELWHELETDLNSKWQRTTWRSPPLRFKTLRIGHFHLLHNTESDQGSRMLGNPGMSTRTGSDRPREIRWEASNSDGKWEVEHLLRTKTCASQEVVGDMWDESSEPA